MSTIYTSHIPSVPLPQESVFTYFFSTIQSRYPESHPAYIDAETGLTITRGQARDLALQLGYGIREVFPKRGGERLKRGDTVMIYSPNSITWPVILFGSVAAGLKVTLANSAYTARELEHQWKDSGAKVVYVHPSLVPTVLETFKLIGFSPAEAKRRIIIANWGFADKSVPQGGYTTVDDLLGKGKLSVEEKFSGEQAKNETCYLCYSSGTTGKPKGVETTHSNITSLVNICDTLYPPTDYRKDVMLGVLPFYHIYGAVKLLHFPYLRGTPVVIMSKFDPTVFCRSIERYKVTSALIVPPICLALVHHPATTKFNIKTLRFLFSGAAPLSGSLVDAVRQKLASVGANVYVTQGYGLTETSPTTHLLPLEHSLRKVGSIGQLLPNLEARLVNEDDTDAKEGEPGELWVRGPTIMKGYLNNRAATENAITPDGWFKTGDIAVRDKEGFYNIVDRRKELIKYKGFQVPPAELEGVLLQHPDIVDAAVIGIDSEKDATELPRAYIVHAKGIKGKEAQEFAQQVKKWMEQRVAKHKFLRGGVIVIDAIPKSAAGKILRRELRERAKMEILTEPEFQTTPVKAKL
ncbi:AMP binding protein [Abortiporus biennis]|nr:AMP binding protein [Abortiporus biennis]